MLEVRSESWEIMEKKGGEKRVMLRIFIFFFKQKTAYEITV